MPPALAVRLGGGALALAAALTVPLAAVNGVLVLFIIVGIAAIAAILASGRWRDIPVAPGMVVLGLLGWAGLSLLWAVDPAHSGRSLATLAAYSFGGLCLFAAADRLAAGARARIGTALVAGICAALVLFTLEGVPRYLGWGQTPERALREALGLPFHLHRLNRAASLLAITVWPAAAVVARRYGWRRGALLPAWAIAILPAFDSNAALLASACGLAAALLGAVLFTAGRPAALRATLMGAIALGFALMPLLPNWGPFHDRFTARSLNGSVWHRAEIWSFAADRIAERPLLGWGLGSARAIPGGDAFIQPGVHRLPLHPHNGVLQLWLELGALGAAFGAAAALLVVRRVAAPGIDPPAAICLAAALAAALAVLLTGYGIWQGWWVGALWMIAAVTRAVLPARGDVPA
jgi:O-antigen ligase